MEPSEKHLTQPDVAGVKRRLAILIHIFTKALATPPEDALARFAAPSMRDEKEKLIGGFQQIFAQQEAKIRVAGIWDEMDETEQKFIRAGVFETTMRQRINASWLAESVMCLSWALACRDQILPYDQQADPKLNNAQAPNQLRDHIKQASLRPQSEIERQREVAELWHWRCRTQMLLTTKRIPDSSLPSGTPMTEIIRMTAEKAAQEGIFAHPIDGDFPVFGRPFREVSEEELSQLTSIAMERHKAFNWLCGYAPGNRWSETPTDT